LARSAGGRPIARRSEPQPQPRRDSENSDSELFALSGQKKDEEDTVTDAPPSACEEKNLAPANQEKTLLGKLSLGSLKKITPRRKGRNPFFDPLCKFPRKRRQRPRK